MPVLASRRSSTALVVVVVPCTMRSMPSTGKPVAAKRRNHAERLVVGRRRRLGDVHLAAVAAVDQDQVGEGSADIDAGDDAARIPRLRRNILSHASKSEMPGLRICRNLERLFRGRILTQYIICILINSGHKSLPLPERRASTPGPDWLGRAGEGLALAPELARRLDLMQHRIRSQDRRRRARCNSRSRPMSMPRRSSR